MLLQLNNIFKWVNTGGNRFFLLKDLSITVEDVRKLDKEYSKKQIDYILDAIENYAKNKSYTSLYLTAKKWLAKEYPKPKVKLVIHPKDYLA